MCPVERRVCAQHGREPMGCKSPVGVPTWTQGEQDKLLTSSRFRFKKFQRDLKNKNFIFAELRVVAYINTLPWQYDI